jgi:exosortase
MPSTWTRCAALLLITVAAYFKTWAELWSVWQESFSYSHGVIVVGISLWLVWRARAALNAIPAAADLHAVPMVLLLSFAWLLTARANVLVAHSMLWPILAFAVVWAGVGWQAARKLVFALAFLYFAIPVWDYFEPVLQVVASNIVGLLISISGTQAIADGSYILLPQATIYIALACSGAHIMVLSLAMGALAGELRGDTLRTRLMIMALAGCLGFAFNAIRILMIVIAYLNPRLHAALESIGHVTFGWWILALDIVVLCLALLLVPLSRRADAPATAKIPAPAATDSLTALVPAVAVALLLPLMAFSLPRVDRYPDPIQSAVSVPGVTGPLSPDLRWEPQFHGAAWAHRAAYLLPNGRVVEFYRNEYHRQSQGEELIASDGNPFPRKAFPVQTTTAVLLQRPAAAAIEAWRTELRDQSGRDWSALYTYVVDGKAERDGLRTRLVTAALSLYSRPAAGVFAVATPCVPDCSTVAADLEQFAGRAYDAYESTAAGLR